MYESQFGGITIQAVTLTFATMFGLLFAYKTGIIKPDRNFLLMVFAVILVVLFPEIALWMPEQMVKNLN